LHYLPVPFELQVLNGDHLRSDLRVDLMNTEFIRYHSDLASFSS
jgi:hypothetical protein